MHGDRTLIGVVGNNVTCSALSENTADNSRGTGLDIHRNVRRIGAPRNLSRTTQLAGNCTQRQVGIAGRSKGAGDIQVLHRTVQRSKDTYQFIISGIVDRKGLAITVEDARKVRDGRPCTRHDEILVQDNLSIGVLETLGRRIGLHLGGKCLQICPQSAKTLVSDLDLVKEFIKIIMIFYSFSTNTIK